VNRKTLILDRTTAGFLVSVSFTPGDNNAILRAETENHSVIKEIPNDEQTMIEAFLHPCLFIEDSAQFFKKKNSEKSL